MRYSAIVYTIVAMTSLVKATAIPDREAPEELASCSTPVRFPLTLQLERSCY